jgi:hypothetical protein
MELLYGEKAKEKDSKKSFAPGYVNKRSKEEVEKDLGKLKACLSEVMGGDLPLGDKMDKILEVNAIIIPELFREFSSSMPSIDKSMIGSRILSAVKDMSGVLLKKRETEVSEEVNPNSPKFQAIFVWFIEVFKMVLDRQGLDTIQINNIFSDLSTELTGWEERISKRLKGLSVKALDEVKNPLLNNVDKDGVTGGFKL